MHFPQRLVRRPLYISVSILSYTNLKNQGEDRMPQGPVPIYESHLPFIIQLPPRLGLGRWREGARV